MSILNSVRAEMAQTEKRLEQLRELERLALELAGDMIEQTAAAAAPAKPPPATARKRRAPGRRPLDVDEVLEGVRDAMHEGPVSVHELHRALGVSRTARTTRIFEDALEQLGAVVAGKRTGGALYALPNGSGAVAAPPAPPARDVDAVYLERRLVALLGRSPHTIAAAAVAIDAPEGAVEDACERLLTAGTVSKLSDGTWAA